MSQRSVTVEGPADAASAWACYDELARWHEWSPQIVDVQASGERLEDGLTGTVIGPLGLRIPFTVLQVRHAERTWVWRIAPPGLRADLRHVVATTSAGCSTRLDVRGPLWFALVYPTLALPALRRLVAR